MINSYNNISREKIYVELVRRNCFQSELRGDELRTSEVPSTVTGQAGRRLVAKWAANGPNASEGEQKDECENPVPWSPPTMGPGLLKRAKLDPGNAGRNPGYGLARRPARLMTLANGLDGNRAGCWWPDLRWSLDPFAKEWISRESRTVSIPELITWSQYNESMNVSGGEGEKEECGKVES